MEYHRYFVSLQSETNGFEYKGREPAGRCVLESRGNKGKISLWVQDLKPEVLYKIALVFMEKEKSVGVPMGTLHVDERGKGEFKGEFRTVLMTNEQGLETFTAVALLAPRNQELICPIVGYKEAPVLWKSHFSLLETSPSLEAAQPHTASEQAPPEQAPPEQAPTEQAPPAPESPPEQTPPVPESPPAPESPPEQALPSESKPETLERTLDAEPEPEAGTQKEIENENEITTAPEPAPAPLEPFHEFANERDFFDGLAEATAPEPVEPTILHYKMYPQEPEPPEPEPQEPEPQEPEPQEPEPQEPEPQQRIAKPFASFAPNTLSPHEELELIFKIYIHMTPFEKQVKEIEWIRISDREPIFLPIDYQNLMNHPFLVAAYKKYKHLILGRFMGVQDVYVLGLPGVYESRYRPVALQLGFGQFKCCDEVKPVEGQYGYWLQSFKL
ncbi:MAG: hypothetical protein LBT44_10585 [Clostridiales bacterium]|nr:hypothetical protein [Clostridiales bacterium]